MSRAAGIPVLQDGADVKHAYPHLAARAGRARA
jgi:hypothetical protein